MPPLVQGPLFHQSALCDRILHALPEWFGIESSTQDYIREVDQLPTFVVVMEGEEVGFLSIKIHNSFSAEAYVMGILKPCHHNGCGRALMLTAEEWLREQNIEYLQVKTLAATHPDPNYACTRAFYLSMGFRPLEVIDSIWGSENPCLVMVKKIVPC